MYNYLDYYQSDAGLTFYPDYLLYRYNNYDPNISGYKHNSIDGNKP